MQGRYILTRGYDKKKLEMTKTEALKKLQEIGSIHPDDVDYMECMFVHEDKLEEVENLLDTIGYDYFGTDYKADNQAVIRWWTKKWNKK